MSWKTVTLGELCEVLDSKRKPITKRDRTEGNYPYYGATGIVDYVGDYIFDEKLVLIGEDGAKWNSGEKTAFIADGKYWVNNHAHVIKPIRTLLLDEWLVYYFLLKDLKEFVTGLTVPKLNQSQLKNIPIPLPPLITQQKIVGKLDAIFSEIDKATAAAEANAKNAESLFQSYLNQVFESGGNGWITTVLDKVCKVDRGSSPRPIKDYFTDSEDGVNWVKIGDTEEGSKYIFSTKQKITKSGAEKSRYVEVGDFILTNSMSYGRPYIMRINGYIHDGWFVLRLNDDVDSEYFYYLLTSPYVQKQFQQLAAGSVVKNVSGDLVKKTILPMPKLGEQKRLAEIFTDKQTTLKRLSEVYAEKKVELNLLRQSILKQAFNGELIKAA
jgi:type I restriction enzyme S subunit